MGSDLAELAGVCLETGDQRLTQARKAYPSPLLPSPQFTTSVEEPYLQGLTGLEKESLNREKFHFPAAPSAADHFKASQSWGVGPMVIHWDRWGELPLESSDILLPFPRASNVNNLLVPIDRGTLLLLAPPSLLPSLLEQWLHLSGEYMKQYPG
ncbi:hypothetical protein PAAG_04623 [Paracoccidioides lutzii Pb01]|uniref:Uncharacterized protein n=1 Tax=Paracoccidioides lutzii (strain ATCC MYA-826 / Pb01) TaxID=502779 RepID=C1H1H9_PARBA|nr:hypothetical protein PAAG_04623 [Paracoccidioides lutzii Pb01]EEH33573.2 hypothetical protein PAAG_04623 [Paracoccidioides lutzii Pb01]